VAKKLGSVCGSPDNKSVVAFILPLNLFLVKGCSEQGSARILSQGVGWISIRLRLSARCFGYGSGAVAMCGHGQMEPVCAMAMAVMVVVASISGERYL
jgi:hypothetical protein